MNGLYTNLLFTTKL